MIGLFFEEIAVGLAVELGSYHFTRENTVKFAKDFDPQAFHLEEEAAASGPFGRLSASGWHTAAGWMKCYVATNDAARAKLSELPETGPSQGFSNLKWLKPVCPGDTLSYRTVVTGKRELASRPKWGMIHSHNEGHNQHGELVFSFEGKVLTARRLVSGPQS